MAPWVCAIVVVGALAAAALVGHDGVQLAFTLVALVAVFGCYPPADVPDTTSHHPHALPPSSDT